jgi:hypothetical protein
MEPFTGSVLVLQHLLREREQPSEPVDPVADGDRKSGDILAPPSRCGLGLTEWERSSSLNPGPLMCSSREKETFDLLDP